MISDDVRITVLQQWNGCHQAFVRLGDLQGIHRFRPDGAPKPLMHGYVLCTNLTGDDFPHHCERTPGPHWLLVCILKSHSTDRAYDEIVRRAENAPAAATVASTAVGVRPPSGDDA